MSGLGGDARPVPSSSSGRRVQRLASRTAALALLAELVDRWSDDEADERALKSEARRILKRHPATVFHDELATVYAPQFLSDAAAMAGAVWLPGDVTKATPAAKTEAKKNGYAIPVGGCAAGSVCVTPTQDGVDPHQLNVTVTAPVSTSVQLEAGTP